eukprot:m.231972 g.231972  ORF g.231972 m.231972 type:complete len:250 (+) comp17071_c1_seq6:182-931(+)
MSLYFSFIFVTWPDRLRQLEKHGLLHHHLKTTMALPAFVSEKAIERTSVLFSRLQSAIRQCQAEATPLTLERLLALTLPDVAATYKYLRDTFGTPREAMRAMYFRPEEFFPRPPDDLLKYDVSIEQSHGSILDPHQDLMLDEEDAFVRVRELSLGLPDFLANVQPTQLCANHLYQCLQIAADACHGLTFSHFPSQWRQDTTIFPRYYKHANSCLAPFEIGHVNLEEGGGKSVPHFELGFFNGLLLWEAT